MILKKIEVADKFTRHPVLHRLLPKVHEDLTATYTRKLHKWLLIAPLIGLMVELTITGVAVIILREMWPVVLAYYLHHHWAIVHGLVLGCALTGLIMQYLTPDPTSTRPRRSSSRTTSTGVPSICALYQQSCWQRSPPSASAGVPRWRVRASTAERLSGRGFGRGCRGCDAFASMNATAASC
jgi:hypothetical protein